MILGWVKLTFSFLAITDNLVVAFIKNNDVLLLSILKGCFLCSLDNKLLKVKWSVSSYFGLLKRQLCISSSPTYLLGPPNEVTQVKDFMLCIWCTSGRQQESVHYSSNWVAL